ncbi:MAG: RIP metalloprotease RseP [Rikenellaceae bacterium]
MEILIRTVQFIIALSILIGIHEFGHFIVARLFKIRVDKFYIFFDPWFSIAKWKWGETEYGIGWLPLGGYCKISGMIDESMDKEQLAQEPKPYEFRSKPAWQRLCVSAAGVVMNILLAVAIYSTVSYIYGEQYIANEDVEWGSNFNQAGEELGFVDGDKILTIDGESIERYADILPLLIITDRDREVVVERDGEAQTINIAMDRLIELRADKAIYSDLLTPISPYVIDSVIYESSIELLEKGDQIIAYRGEKIIDMYALIDSIRQDAGGVAPVSILRGGKSINLDIPVHFDGRIGVMTGNSIPTRVSNYSLLGSIPAGFVRTGKTISSYWSQLAMIVKPETKLYKEVGGFVAIAGIFSTQWNWLDFWLKVAYFSVMLAVINILPIPALDGGHVLFTLWEIITGRKPSDKFLEITQFIGMILIIALFVFANGSDMFRLFK